MYWNWKRKSTKGWSIVNILLDFTGGFFSFLQMALEAINGVEVKINPVKLILAIMCMVYDIIFVVQHYCLYPEKRIPDNSLNEGLLEDGAINRDTMNSLPVEEPTQPVLQTLPVDEPPHEPPQEQAQQPQQA